MTKRRKCGPDEHYDLNVFGYLLLLPAWGWLWICYSTMRDAYPGKFLRIWSYHNRDLGGVAIFAAIAILPLALIFIFMRTGPIPNLREREGDEYYDLSGRGYLLLLPSLVWVIALYLFLRNEFPREFAKMWSDQHLTHVVASIAVWSYRHPTNFVFVIIVAVIALLPLVLMARYTIAGPFKRIPVVRLIH